MEAALAADPEAKERLEATEAKRTAHLAKMVERDAKVAKPTVASEAKPLAITDGSNPVFSPSSTSLVVSRVADKRQPADEVAPSGGRVGKAAKAELAVAPTSAPREK
jgi:hypothetical protein